METMKFKGTGVALITPFKPNKRIDFEALQNLIERQIANGIDFFVLLGSTAETATLSDEEQWAVVEFCHAQIRDRKPIIVGATDNNTHKLIKRIQRFNFEGISGLLTAAPFYNKPSQEGMFRHFSEVAYASPVPVILYNVPGRTASHITSQTVLRLAGAFDNIVGIKEASGDPQQVSEIIAARPQGFHVLSGDDPLTLPYMALGADGIISVTANMYPKTFGDIARACLNNDYALARRRHYEMLPQIGRFFAEGNPAGVKAALHASGLIHNELRLPLTPVSEDLLQEIKENLLAEG